MRNPRWSATIAMKTIRNKVTQFIGCLIKSTLIISIVDFLAGFRATFLLNDFHSRAEYRERESNHQNNSDPIRRVPTNDCGL